jgi:hypothetical protein
VTSFDPDPAALETMRTGAAFAATSLALLAPLVGGTALAALGVWETPEVHADMTQDDDPDGPQGYTDTPKLPGSEWRVHDKHRPVPPVVTPGAGTAPPSDAIVFFDGTDASGFHQNGQDVAWRIADGEMTVTGGGQITSRAAFGDMQLHLEWASPVEVQGHSQHRGNSGVFLMGRYEVQILDSYENRSYADGQAAALYGQYPPDVNASRAPGEWQSYDILFKAPRFDGEELVSPGVVTVLHNGVVVHHAREFIGATRHRDVAQYAAHEEKLPFSIQDHGNPVKFRNIWVREL